MGLNVKRAAKLLIGALVVLPAGSAAYYFRNEIKDLKLPFALPFMQAAEAERGVAAAPPPRPSMLRSNP